MNKKIIVLVVMIILFVSLCFTECGNKKDSIIYSSRKYNNEFLEASYEVKETESILNVKYKGELSDLTGAECFILYFCYNNGKNNKYYEFDKEECQEMYIVI